jgi:hypothetical protein
MIFELISWVYISLVCLIWGNAVLKVYFGVQKVTSIDFPIICFAGLTVIGIISFYFSLLMPLNFVFKLALQIPALLVLLNSEKRNEIITQLKSPFLNFHKSDFLLLLVSLLMILLLSSALVIHPDTLNYHVISVEVLDKYGTIPGIGNVQMNMGFQSLWFAESALFDFSFFHSAMWFPLSGSVVAWFVIFLISKCTTGKIVLPGLKSFPDAFWWLLFVLFCILSWTQIRLTASSLSPDFIAAIAVLLSFYFFYSEKMNKGLFDKSDLLASFFSITAVTIKLSTAPILLVPCFAIGRAISRKKWLFAGYLMVTIVLFCTPVLIRNFISTGYPFYPSTIAAFIPFEWKINATKLISLQHYITSYARFPVYMSQVPQEYNNSIGIWLPPWWRHLYLVDKLLILLVLFGLFVDALCFKSWIHFYSRKGMLTILIAVTGVIFWFLGAPDPRFGTGFLIPLIYFQFVPFFEKPGIRINEYQILSWVKNISSLFILIYIGYRTVYFFHTRQMVFPEGIKYTSLIQPDCEGQIKKMILENDTPVQEITDSCRHFIYRGKTIKQGFIPAQ